MGVVLTISSAITQGYNELTLHLDQPILLDHIGQLLLFILSLGSCFLHSRDLLVDLEHVSVVCGPERGLSDEGGVDISEGLLISSAPIISKT